MPLKAGHYFLAVCLLTAKVRYVANASELFSERSKKINIDIQSICASRKNGHAIVTESCWEAIVPQHTDGFLHLER